MAERLETTQPERVAGAAVQPAPTTGSSQAGELEARAGRLASQHAVARQPGKYPPPTAFIGQYADFFAAANRIFRSASEKELPYTYAAEWMLDNDYIVRQGLREIRQDFPAKFYRQLPKLTGGPFAGSPRAYVLAREIIHFDKAHLDMDRVRRFVHAYQAQAVLTMGELWALPILLRLGIIQALASAIRDLIQPPATLTDPLLESMNLSDESPAEDTVANCILSLRALAAEDWKDFFENQSVVESILNRDPGGLYAGMDFETRDRYRKVVEALSLSTGREETELAREAVRLAQEALDRSGEAQPGILSTPTNSGEDGRETLGAGWDGFASPRLAHVGAYLVGEGRLVLERQAGFRPAGSERLKRWVFAHPTLVYVGGIALFSALLAAGMAAYALANGASAALTTLAVLLALAPALTLVVHFANWAITQLIPPAVLPKMNFESGVPPECATLIAIPGLLSSAGDVDSLFSQLELHYLRNADPHFRFALLTDFADAAEANRPEDETLLEQARQALERLNRKYRRQGSEPFLFLHRERRWNECEGVWMGWERKRGKLHELNRLLRGSQDTSFIVLEGDLDSLRRTRYVITLDADTILPKESGRQLVACLAHPLNRAVVNADGNVLAGYTVLQPRTEINPSSANRSWFTQLFSGDTGLDLYTLAVSDVYQDLFGEGIYVGKGIYDVDAFERSLEGAVPENALLSHDLFEGIHGRAGLVTDIILLEEYPSNYLVESRRSSRWIRGDWQLLPWLFPSVPAAGGGRQPNKLPLIDRWKIFDNLRRSLVPLALLALFLAGWMLLPGSPLTWTAAGLLALGAPFVTDLLAALLASFRGRASAQTFARVRDSFLRWLLSVAFIPYEALLSFEAIGTTLVRLFVTRRHLLKWTTSAQAALRIGDELSPRITWQHMVLSLILTAGLSLLVSWRDPFVLPVAAPVLVLWMISPEIVMWLNRPIAPPAAPLDDQQREDMRLLARRTWLFFEQFMGPEDHWLPPDHFQESPLGVVAHRTSPTNIGLALLSSLAAYDFGYIGALDLASRLRSTFESLDSLERHRGHLLNWYDTRSLQPLTPRYVSTVDSGNLAACLIALAQGCRTLTDRPVLRWETWQGYFDTLSMLLDLVKEMENQQGEAAPLRRLLQSIQARVSSVREQPFEWISLLIDLSERGENEIEKALLDLIEQTTGELSAETLRRLRVETLRLRQHIENSLREIKLLVPWRLTLLTGPASLSDPAAPPALRQAWFDLNTALAPLASLANMDDLRRVAQASLENLRNALPDGSPELVEWCTRLENELVEASMAAKTLAIGFADIERRCEQLVHDMDFSFLFDSERKVFHIGYNLELGRLDANYYDLLASEARIASLVAIAKGDVPQSHWLHLSRPLTLAAGRRALLSWSATMFEYLMPALLLRSYEGTLLNQSAQAAIDYQMAYALDRRVPWGVSESGYYRFDANMVYQYRAFGVPGLGYKRGLGDDLVVTPYASLLALPFRPKAVWNNVESLERLEMLGAYGLYEAIDFTPARLSLGNTSQRVLEYMAHHQGMIFLSLANYFHDCEMVKRFHADPRVQSVELLLQEQIPLEAPVEVPHLQNAPAPLPEPPRAALTPWRAPVNVAQPRLHFLSNGRYGVLITSAGGGYSTWKGVDLTRWRADTTLGNWGMWIYVQELDANSGEPQALWSAGLQPTGAAPQSRDVFFNAHMAEFRRRDREISTNMEVTVAPDDDIEIRCVTLTNHSERTRRLRLTSYAEIVMAPQATDQRHPAFNKLFIESEWLEAGSLLLYRRRPRSEDEEPLFMGHALVLENGLAFSGSYEGDREAFLGRGGSIRCPRALCSGKEWAGTVGATLDPILSLSQEVELKPHATVQLAFLNLAAASRQEALALATRYRAWHMISRVYNQARAQAEVELRQLGLNTSLLQRIEQLLALLLYPHPALRAPAATLAANTEGQRNLWAYSISGDYPILLVRLNDPDELTLVNDLLKAHAYWRNRGLKIDLVILNLQGTNYGQELTGGLHRLLERMHADAWLNRRGGIFIVFRDRMSEADLTLLETAALAILDGNGGSLADQVRALGRLPARLPLFNPGPAAPPSNEPAVPLSRPQDLLFDNGLGGFSQDGCEYVVFLDEGRWTPAPWVNVIASPRFGFMVTEAGSGYTWAENSAENRLTPWTNDPVSDPAGEAVYLRDEETGEVWSPAPQPARDPAPYLVRHGAGYTIFEHNSHGLAQHLKLYISPEEPVKVVRLRLQNHSGRIRRITATFYAEWVLGVNRESSQQYVVPEYDGEVQALLARNAYSMEFGQRVAFAAASRPLHGLTADRTEFLGRLGNRSFPAALKRIGLAGSVQAGQDPCAALQVHLDFQPGEQQELWFLLGQGENREDALRLARRFKDLPEVDAAWEASLRQWDEILGAVQVQTPEPSMDLLLNRWLLYQALSCRIWGRSAFYQSGGAFGFRDQLQDVMALLHTAPNLAREHILRSARHQFEAGDVLHWWHPPSGRGVRTRFSDDLLWLPFVTAHYVLTTGDDSILDEKEPFRRGPMLEPGEDERYDQYGLTQESYTLYEHCRRAIERGATSGAHGLPRMGTGDWNDGMNRVGAGGRGESVWLGWFLYDTLQQFARLADRRSDAPLANAYRERSQALSRALEENAWDGQWYLRAFYDDGTPLGSSTNRECQIDSIAQSWGVLSQAADPQRARRAMQSVSERLVRKQDRLILLFTPPFDRTPRDPGYIKGYLPGIRENGGQYTHAALWAVWAFAELGQGETAEELFRLLNPIHHTSTPEGVQRYQVEPYVVAADVYSVPPHTGRGGWTWYTGSSGWMLRLGLEAILGLRRQGDTLRLDPRIPAHWPGYSITYRFGQGCYLIRVENPSGVEQGVQSVTLDGVRLPEGAIPLQPGHGDRQVVVVMG